MKLGTLQVGTVCFRIQAEPVLSQVYRPNIKAALTNVFRDLDVCKARCNSQREIFPLAAMPLSILKWSSPFYYLFLVGEKLFIIICEDPII